MAPPNLIPVNIPFSERIPFHLRRDSVSVVVRSYRPTPMSAFVRVDIQSPPAARFATLPLISDSLCRFVAGMIKDSATLLSRGNSCAGAEKWAEAHAFYYKAARLLEKDPLDTDPPTPEETQAWLLAAVYGDRAQIPNQVTLIKCYEEAGDQLRRTKEPLIADACYHRAIEIALEHKAGHVHILMEKMRRLRSTDYEPAIERAKRENGYPYQQSPADLHAARAWTHLRKGNASAACSDFAEEDALIANGRGEIERANHRIRRGIVLWQANKRDMAIQDFVRANELVSQILSRDIVSSSDYFPLNQLLTDMNIAFNRLGFYDQALLVLVCRESLTVQTPTFEGQYPYAVLETNTYLEQHRHQISPETQAYALWMKGYIEMRFGQRQDSFRSLKHARNAFIQAYEICRSRLASTMLGQAIAYNIARSNVIEVLWNRLLGEIPGIDHHPLHPLAIAGVAETSYRLWSFQGEETQFQPADLVRLETLQEIFYQEIIQGNYYLARQALMSITLLHLL